MASFDEIKEKAVDAFDRAKPVVEGAVSASADKAAELAEKADEWASGEHPGADKAMNALGNVADGAVNAVADGANVAYEFIKDQAERISKRDIDGDGFIGKASEGAQASVAEAGVEAAADAAEEPGRKAASVSKAVAERITNTDIDGDGKIG